MTASPLTRFRATVASTDSNSSRPRSTKGCNSTPRDFAATSVRHGLFEQFKALSAKVSRESAETGHIPPGMSKRCDEPTPDRIGDFDHDDRDSRRRRLSSDSRSCADREDYIHIQSSEISCQH